MAKRAKRVIPEPERTTWSPEFLALMGSAPDFPEPPDPGPVEPGPDLDDFDHFDR